MLSVLEFFWFPKLIQWAIKKFKYPANPAVDCLGMHNIASSAMLQTGLELVDCYVRMVYEKGFYRFSVSLANCELKGWIFMFPVFAQSIYENWIPVIGF